MRFTQNDVRRFAEWSGDRNPLHVDAAYARGTAFGRPVVHGVLAVIEALRERLRDADEPLETLDIEFRAAVFPDTDYLVEEGSVDATRSIVAQSAEGPRLIVRVNGPGGNSPLGSDTRPLRAAGTSDAGLRSAPASLDVGDLRVGTEFVGSYDISAPTDAGITAGRLPATKARVLALCSYAVGMELPGLRSLFTRLNLWFNEVTSPASQLLYRLRVVRFDPQFRILDVHLDVWTADGRTVAGGELRSYVRFSPTAVNAARLIQGLRQPDRLAGKVALVCGGTRGLGAELSAALALSGCRVYASYHRDAAAARELQASLAPHGAQVELLEGDAGDPTWCEASKKVIEGRERRLDILVLNACEAPAPLRLAAETVSEFGSYIGRNLSLVQVPTAAFLDSLNQNDGTIVAISSSFVEDAPQGFAHYVALKEAVEATVLATARETRRVTALIARPPRLQTTWNDTPTAVLGTIPASTAAIHIVNRLAAGRDVGAPVLSQFPPLPTIVERSAPKPAEFSLLLSATFTCEPILAGLSFWLNEFGLRGDIQVAPYGQILQTLLDPTRVTSRRIRAHVVLIRVRDWLRELGSEQAGSIDFLRSYLSGLAQDLERAIRAHQGRSSGETLIVFCPSEIDEATPEDELLGRAERDLAVGLDAIAGVTVVRAEDWHTAYGVVESGVRDHVREHLAHVPYQSGYFHTLATIVMRHVSRSLVPARKVVVVDCDNTLWRGVVGEVGAEGLHFDPAHHALHKKLAKLSESGMLVALCSKNEEADVWRVFETRTDFALRRDQIVAAAIDWQPKSSNLRMLSARLNLGLESFVFLDDNPLECAEVRAACPEVLTLQWPVDADRAERLLEHTWELDARRATSEDQRRTELYKEEFRRQELQAQTLTFAEFLASLDLVVNVEPLVTDDVKRASQLTLRTNQFNFTTRRRSEGEVHTLLSAGKHEIRTVRVRDRFGDYGLVGLLIAEIGATEIFADTFLLSCRVLGRGVEHQMMNELGRIAAARSTEVVKIRIEPTNRNAPARMFLESLAPPQLITRDGGVLEASVPAAWAAQVTFEPREHAAATPPAIDDSARTSVVIDGTRMRSREDQIARTAFQLSTAAALTAAIDQPELTQPSPTTTADPRDVVEGLFAKALRLDPADVRRIDSLEALGCDSFKIVEITVSLMERFPSLPATLLFEHRSVSELVSRIEAIVSAKVSPSPVPARHTPNLPSPAGGEDIAVVGMHLRCAGARSPEELWDLLSEGRVSVAPVPAERPYFLGRLDDDRPHFAGLLDEIDRFDPELFGITPREAELMDPQLRLFLQVAWNALEDAGSLGSGFDPQTGVFAGVMYSDYAHRANLIARRGDNPFKSWEAFSLANRLSQIFGFQGPSLAVDTACSSSGTAIHLACRALKAGDCNVALAGGVNLILDPDRFVQLGRLGILSMSGRCLAFGADADGTVLGEGAGVVVLRPLADALRRGDRVYGVIKATGVSTGSGTVGFTAPNPQAQAQAIRRAVQSAGIDPRTISYVETHGTGTALGDPIEVRGLSLAFDDRTLWDDRIAAAQRCSIGSIKPNIGHLEAGAGVLGLIKILLQLQHRMLLPSVTSDQPNPQIPFEQTPFSIQRTLTPWDPPSAAGTGVSSPLPRRAALNSFGVGGANAHVIVEEAPAPATQVAEVERPMHILALSAGTEESLHRRVRSTAELLAARPELGLADLCFSANTGLRHLDWRMAVTASTREEMIAALSGFAVDGGPGNASPTAVRAATRPKIAFLFTGQGSQYAGMGRGLYEAHPIFRQALDRCFSLFDPLLDRSLRETVFADPGSDDAQLLHRTGYTQPALFALGYALSELWRSWGIKPDIVMGHSVGEITAMCVAGGISLEDAVILIAARGRLMQALPAGGAMTSVMTAEARVLHEITGYEDRVAIAAINGPEQVVISGDGMAVAAIAARFGAEGIRTKDLVVSHAFHSPLMRPMIGEYEAVVRGIRFVQPSVGFVSCVLGRAAGSELIEADYWIRNVIDPVRFTDAIRSVESMGVQSFVEIGPQPILTGMARQTLGADDENREWLPSMRKDAPALAPLLEALGRIYSRGHDIDWRGFDAPWQRRRVSVPPYPFAKKRFWIRALPVSVASSPQRSDGETPPDGATAYDVTWRRHDSHGARRSIAGRHWILVGDSDDRLSQSLALALQASGTRCTVFDPRRKLVDSFVELPRYDGIVYLASTAASAQIADHAEDGLRACEEAGALMRAFSQAADSPSAHLYVVTRGGVTVDSGVPVPVALAHSALWGLGRTFALEHPQKWGGLIDAEPALDASVAAASILDEISGDTHEDQIALRRHGRYVPRLVARGERPVGSVAVAADRTYLITGGMGALGLRVARWLLARGARHVLLTGRRGAETPDAATALLDLRSTGANVRVLSADSSTAEGIDRALAAVDPAVPLAGIFHAAGVDEVRPVADLQTGDFIRVMSAKVRGAWLLHERTRQGPLDYFVCFSSIASVLGSAGRAAYAAANAFLDGLAHERRRLGLHALSVNWGPWAGGGMATASTLEQYRRIGNHGIIPDDGIRALERLLPASTAQAAVVSIDWEAFRTAYQAQRPRPLIAELGVGASGGSTPVTKPTAAPWIELLSRVTDDQRLETLVALLRGEIAQTLGFTGPDEVAPDRPFKDMGMDSLMSADFAQRLQKRTGIRSTALVFEHPSVMDLARHLADHPSVRPTAVALDGDVFPAETPPPVSATVVERYRPELEAEVFGFQQRAWPTRSEQLIPARWQWMFVRSAERLGISPQAWLHRQDGQIVGHNGAIPVHLKVGSSEHRTAWLVDTMVLKEYRDQGVGARLMMEAHSDLPFALSLGQTQQMRDIQLRLGWAEVAPLSNAVFLIRPERVLQGKLPAPAAFAASVGLRATDGIRNLMRAAPQGQVREIARFDESHDALWSRAAADIHCAVTRDASYMNWKYVDQPGQEFIRLQLLDDGGVPQGVVVCMLRDPDGVYAYRRAFLVDLVAPLRSQELLQQLIAVAVKAAADRNADAITCFHINDRLTRALRRSGFRLREPERYLLVRPEGLDQDTRCAVLAPSNWFVTQGDSDIDRPEGRPEQTLLQAVHSR